MVNDADRTTTGIMATLALLTAMAPTERPSGETLAQQQQRISDGIDHLLADDTLWSSGWQLRWVGLTEDRANMAFIASSVDPVAFVLSVRGTVFSSVIDVLEDIAVGAQFSFPFGGKISGGALAASNATLCARCVLDDVAGMQNTTLTEALAELTKGISAPVVYVTGHSLGGALTTTLSLQLATRMPHAALRPYTFAAPTSGDAAFAAAFDQRFPNAVCEWNRYDAVPRAWAELTAVEDFFPDPGPRASDDERRLITQIDGLRHGNVYAQPTRQPALNAGYTIHGPEQSGFLDELPFQHAGNTYLALLGAPTIDWRVPDVDSISPRWVEYGTAMEVTITPAAATTFTCDCVVDFGFLDSYSPAASATVAPDGTSIAATLSTNAYYGTHAAYVTNMYGTSSAAYFAVY